MLTPCRLFSRLLVILCYFFALSPATAAEPDLPLFNSYYSLYVFGMKVGEGVRRLKDTGDGQFAIQSSTTTTGMVAMFRDDVVEEHSLWYWEDGQIRPLNYLYRHVGSYTKKRSELRFDWDKNVVHFDHKGKQGDLEVEPGMLDQLLYQVALMIELKQGKRGDIAYTIVDGGKIKQYSLKFVGEERVKTPIGKFSALKFKRLDEDGRSSTLWCAPALWYLPVRAEHEEPKGEKVVMVLDRVEGLGR